MTLLLKICISGFASKGLRVLKKRPEPGNYRLLLLSRRLTPCWGLKKRFLHSANCIPSACGDQVLGNERRVWPSTSFLSFNLRQHSEEPQEPQTSHSLTKVSLYPRFLDYERENRMPLRLERETRTFCYYSKTLTSHAIANPQGARLLLTIANYWQSCHTRRT